MKKKFDYLIMPLLMLVLVACGGDTYDDDELWKQVNSNTSRIENLEKQVNQINADISQLRLLINASQSGVTITNVRETTTGYVIQFSDGTSIEVKNGKDGKDGNNAPTVGVELYNGIYYWTLTIDGRTTWLTDDNGNRIQASGQDGQNGQNGINGANGKDGQDGVTPLLKVDAEGYWIVSYDGGKTYNPILDVNGHKVKAVATEGGSGVTNSIFYDVTINESTVVFVLKNGGTFSLPLDKPFAIGFSQTGGFELPDLYSEVTIPFTVTGYDYDTFIEICVHGNLQAELTYYGGEKGSIRVRRTGDITSDTKVMVFLCNKRKTITYVLTFNGYVDNRLHQVIPDEILEKVRVYIPIYEGVDPPFVEGSYLIDKMTCVYCSDNGYSYGDAVVPTYIRFMNQDRKNNTLDYEEKEGDSYAIGNGAFISGSGNNFTAFFNTEGYSSGGTWYKTALVISGTWTVSGIKNLYYAFVMVDKGYEATPHLMDVGGFRVFEDQDGMAENASWVLGTRSTEVSNAVKYLNYKFSAGVKKN